MIMMLIYLAIFAFVVYFLISVLQFMRTKSHNDKLLLHKMDDISQKLDELKEKKY
ncbi:DUF4083 family protein [Lentibacillus kimchii]|uniref:DUF4083 family protein n=1 Tax=Lentibacillus kimchii TaxID=1542911 RepID=A0ABW2USN1_9BACI